MKNKKVFVCLTLLLAVFFSAVPAHAGWIWSPDLGRWMNLKDSAKDTPDEQFNWAIEFYNNEQWDRAIEEFEKLPKYFPNSRLAAEGVYYAGLCWEKKGDIGKAADAYQKLIDRYPYSDRIQDATEREFQIANEFAAGRKLKVLGLPALPGHDRAIELYQHIIRNAPFGTYGAEAQFKLGQVYQTLGEYEEAQRAFQTVVDEYPNSELVTEAKYEIANSAMLATKRMQYNEELTQRAIEEFEGFKKRFPEDTQVLDAEESIKALRVKKAFNNYETAIFYERQKQFKSARIYYEDVIRKYPETLYAQDAKQRLEKMTDAEMQKRKGGFKLKLW